MNNYERNKSTILFGVFIKKFELNDALQFIRENFEVPSNFVFLYKVRHNMLLSFTARRGELNENIKNSTYKIITLQRNREFNTFFTINAINHLVKERVGKIDPSYKLDFSEYQDILLYTHEDNLFRSKLEFQNRLKLFRDNQNQQLNEEYSSLENNITNQE